MDTALTHIADAALIEEVMRLAQSERHATARLIAALAELDARRLYLGQGCASLFVYCTRVLHLSEHAAYGRIEAARAARKYPEVLQRLEAGEVTLTAVGLLAPHLTPDNHRELLTRARHKTKRDVEEIVATLRPLPDVKPMVRKLPSAASPTPVKLHTPMALTDAAAEPSPTPQSPATGGVRPDSAQKPVIKPLAPERYKLQLTVSRDTIDDLRRAQDLMRHVTPDGDPALVIGRALRLLVEDLEKRRAAVVARPRSTAANNETATRRHVSLSRHVPASVRRAVWRRDGGRCAFTGAAGRCSETGFLEYHHVLPFADGGEATVNNIQLRCRAHNQHEARLVFGAVG